MKSTLLIVTIALIANVVRMQVVSSADVATDSCLSVSTMPSVTTALQSNATLLNLLRDASTLDQIVQGVQQLYKTVADLTAVKNGYVTTAYVGFGNDNVYGLRDCSLPENAPLTGCNVDGSHWIALIRNEVVFSDQVRHRFSITANGQVDLSQMWNDTNPFMTTQRGWYTTQGWQFFQNSVATGLSTYALSALASPGIVVAADRSWREPCNDCLTNSFAESTVERVLDSFNVPNSVDEFPTLLTSMLGLLIQTSSPSALQIQVGLNDGSLFLVKDCLQLELRNAIPACADNDRYVGLVVHPLDTPRAYRLSLAGVVSSSVAPSASNATTQHWFTVASEQNQGFTAPLLTASAAVIARSYSSKFNKGVASVELSERECFTMPSDTQELVTNPSNDECLSRSTVADVLNKNLNSLPALSTVSKLSELVSLVKDLAPIVANFTYVNGPVTAIHFGANSGDYYSLRACYLPENRVQAGCDGVAYFALYAASKTVFGDGLLRIFPVTFNGDVNTSVSIMASTIPFNLTSWLWYSQASSAAWTQRGGFYPSYTYSTPVMGGVWALDRSYREPCNQCLTDSVSSDVANQLALFANGRQVVNTSRDSFNAIIQQIYQTLNSHGDVAIQAYYGLWDGSFFMVKRCSAEEFNHESPCSSAAPFTNNGALTQNEIYTSDIFFPTSRPWYQIGRTAQYGWSGVFAHASSAMSGRTYAQQFNAGVIGVDFTSRECEPRAPHVTSSAVSVVPAIASAIGAIVAVMI
ncbi:hypothetical protein C9890_0284 [Perkinsus sp. BL_2016]|nr:hypothetical protein C9890_0284 [Perkinsus sp. BL_2016]